MVAVIVGLFLAGLAYLHYHYITNVNWNKLQQATEGAITTLSNLIAQILGISSTSDRHAATASSLAMTNFGIPFEIIFLSVAGWKNIAMLSLG